MRAAACTHLLDEDKGSACLNPCVPPYYVVQYVLLNSLLTSRFYYSTSTLSRILNQAENRGNCELPICRSLCYLSVDRGAYQEMPRTISGGCMVARHSACSSHCSVFGHQDMSCPKQVMSMLRQLLLGVKGNNP
jgi:hypothetical protein